MTKMKLYVWTNFARDYTAGLAVAIARNEQEARAQIEKFFGHPVSGYWGTLSVHSLRKRATFAVYGGG